MVVETGYQMPTSAVEHLPIVVIFSIVYIFTRDVPYYDHRCVISNAPPLAPSSPSLVLAYHIPCTILGMVHGVYHGTYHGAYHCG